MTTEDFDVVWHGATWRDFPARTEDMVYRLREKGASGMVTRPRDGVNPQVIGERLETIKRRKGRITPQIVVEDARPSASPLHEYFEWNDDRAADQWRLTQARTLISSVYIVEASELQGQPVMTRAFVSVDAQTDAHYEPIATVLSDAAMYAQVCRRAHSELIAFQDRYADFFSLKQIGKRAADLVEAELQAIESAAAERAAS